MRLPRVHPTDPTDPTDRSDRPTTKLLLLLALLPICATAAPANFRTDILPLLTKAGCNAGACHGAATGQGGFKLSLLGYDPEEDFQRITRERGGRRIDLEQPSASLILLKPSRQLEHEGGRRLPRSSTSYAKLLDWIAAGAPYGPPKLRVTGISVKPVDSLLTETNREHSLQVRAVLSDGSEQEVTSLALYSSNDDAIAEVSPEGKVVMRGPGLTSIMIRYGGQVAAARVALPFPQTGAIEFPANNFIDEQIGAELKRLNLPPSSLSDAAQFLRRVYLDLNGRLPAAETVRQFLSQPDTAQSRLQIIDELLERDEFVDLWTMHWADLLLVGNRRSAEKPAAVYHNWLRAQVARNTPFDQVAGALLTAEGDLTQNPAANFFTLATDPRDLAEHVSRIFLGTQIACARCHAHPADRWTQDDYYQFSAYFARVEHEGNAIKVSTRGEVDHPKSGLPVLPRPLGVTPATNHSSREEDRRLELAQWVTDPHNPMFARATANRVWKYLFGRGLVEPVDDLRPTNPATHPALLDALAADFVSHGYDLRALIRLMVASRTYQLSSRSSGNAPDDRFYSHAYLKELSAQVYVDAIAQVTGVPDTFQEYNAGTRAVQLVGTRTPSYALDVLGRCTRELPCDSSVHFGGGMASALHMINGPTINEKLQRGIVAEWCASNRSDQQIIEDLYLRALSRPPEAKERAEWESWLVLAPNKKEAVQDVLWALLNSREFVFNH
jgi:hypothetical protein